MAVDSVKVERITCDIPVSTENALCRVQNLVRKSVDFIDVELHGLISGERDRHDTLRRVWLGVLSVWAEDLLRAHCMVSLLAQDGNLEPEDVEFYMQRRFGGVIHERARSSFVPAEQK